MQHFDGARLSPNSVLNAVWHALNEPVCQYLRTRNPRCSTVYIDNSLGPLARDSPCIKQAGNGSTVTLDGRQTDQFKRCYEWLYLKTANNPDVSRRMDRGTAVL